MKKRSIGRKKDYFSKVRKKQNRDWSRKEKIQIYTLRDSGMPAKDVARKFKCNVTNVYNITRLMRRGLKQKCFRCSTPLTAEELAQKGFFKACKKCKKEFKEYKKGLRDEALKKGLCGYCHTDPIIPGYNSCVRCISATHRRRNKKGLCGQCGDRPPHREGASLCSVCLAINEARITDKRHRGE